MSGKWVYISLVVKLELDVRKMEKFRRKPRFCTDTDAEMNISIYFTKFLPHVIKLSTLWHQSMVVRYNFSLTNSHVTILACLVCVAYATADQDLWLLSRVKPKVFLGFSYKKCLLLVTYIMELYVFTPEFRSARYTGCHEHV